MNSLYVVVGLNVTSLLVHYLVVLRYIRGLLTSWSTDGKLRSTLQPQIVVFHIHYSNLAVLKLAIIELWLRLWSLGKSSKRGMLLLLELALLLSSLNI